MGFRISDLIKKLTDFKNSSNNCVINSLIFKLSGVDDKGVPHRLYSQILPLEIDDRDDYWCTDCKKTTEHKMRYSGHERDSSGDVMICSVCGKYTSGHDDDYLRTEDD